MKDVNYELQKRIKSMEHFETATCSLCESVNRLRKHKYSDELMCASCVDDINDELNAAAKLEEYGSLNELQLEREE